MSPDREKPRQYDPEIARETAINLVTELCFIGVRMDPIKNRIEIPKDAEGTSNMRDLVDGLKEARLDREARNRRDLLPGSGYSPQAPDSASSSPFIKSPYGPGSISSGKE